MHGAITRVRKKPKSELDNYFCWPGGNPIQRHKIIAVPTAKRSAPQTQTSTKREQQKIHTQLWPPQQTICNRTQKTKAIRKYSNSNSVRRFKCRRTAFGGNVTLVLGLLTVFKPKPKLRFSTTTEQNQNRNFFVGLDTVLSYRVIWPSTTSMLFFYQPNDHRLSEVLHSTHQNNQKPNWNRGFCWKTEPNRTGNGISGTVTALISTCKLSHHEGCIVGRWKLATCQRRLVISYCDFRITINDAFITRKMPLQHSCNLVI